MWVLEDFKQTMGTEVLSNIYVLHPLPSEINTALYRIIQESLTNIYKHAQAKMVNLELQQQSGMICLAIEDNSPGFQPKQNTTGFGLQGIRERTAALCGQFMIDSQPGAGCRLSISLPLNNFTANSSYDSHPPIAILNKLRTSHPPGETFSTPLKFANQLGSL